ncbi:formylmethanofuran dehydrogenase subunit C [Methanospirillum lacunae]|uniref:formylmethanofuran dehydrogenase n=1 Tax=Methanospirillum lacunae TaxID=668570 RepID=A0A2V2MTK7_9EURY|nr:formylmethanofuran dehydrogenase subunit C [Methanospirillum lacunae]PWR71362.1 formylmethanofuran dehydrogenase subunit C [Methanospirillum lacunae]
METVTMTLVQQPELYLECYSVTPDKFAGKSLTEIADLPAHEGKVVWKLGDFFSFSGKAGETAADTKIIVNGNVRKMKRFGQQMTAGEILINSDADMYVGCWMRGGKITVKGNADAFLGIGMEGGEILIEGDADNHVGSAYRGDWRGMSGGLIRVKGKAGNDVGTAMTGGTIIIEGDVFIHVLTHAEGGTVIIKGDVEGRVGGQLVKGDAYILGKLLYPMPGYKKVGTVEKECDGQTYTFDEYIGDLGERKEKKKGQIVWGHIYLKAN